MPERLFLGAQVGFFRSDEAGAPGSWNCVAGPRDPTAGFAERNGVLYAATVFVELLEEPDGGVRELTELGLYRTTDGGASWDSLSVPQGTQGATVTAVDPARGRVLIGTRAGLWAVTP